VLFNGESLAKHWLRLIQLSFILQDCRQVIQTDRYVGMLLAFHPS
jgi:hypothetical protein